jgi:hypothetical protein
LEGSQLWWVALLRVTIERILYLFQMSVALVQLGPSSHRES